MVDISILVLQQAVPASIADTAHVFATVNEFLQQQGKEPLFNVNLVGLSDEISPQKGRFFIKPDSTVAEVVVTNLVIIPALMGDAVGGAYLNRGYTPWITAQYKKGAAIASLCTGAFLLAYTGLLRNRQCTTHWAYANEFRYYFPDVKLLDEKMITFHQDLYTSGGNNAWWNLLLYLVEKYANREMAIRIAKYFVIDVDRRDQSPFIIFNGQKDHGDESMIEVQTFIEQHFADKLNVDELAERFNMSRRNFERRFKKATRNTVVQYIQRVKIEATKKQLELGRKSVDDVMYEVNYADLKSFRSLFKKITGMTPNDYRNKYNTDK